MTTERLLLRQFVEGDWAAVHAYAADPEVFRYRNSRPHMTEEQTRELVRQIVARQAQQPRTECFFAIVLRGEDRLIGECFLRVISSDDGEAYMGYSLNRCYWGQGYMTEAVRALIRFGFEALGLRRIVAGCHPENVGSWRVMEKAGMRRQPLPASGERPPGAPRGLLYEIHEHEWQEREAGALQPVTTRISV